jgi:Tol biopolymer transport system component
MAVQLDTRRMQIVGEPVALEPRVTAIGTGSAVGLSEGGTLVYRAADATTIARIELVDTTGRARPLPGEFAAQGFIRFSPNGQRLALGLGQTGVRTGRPDARPQYDLWAIDVATGEPTRITSDGIASGPAWSADGSRLLFTAVKGAKSELWSAAVDGSGAAKLAALQGNVMFSAAHPDGKSVLVSEVAANGEGISLLRVWIDGTNQADTLYVERRHGGVRPLWPRVSPDGRFVAYVDYSSSAVYVRSLTGPSVMQVSTLPTNRNPVVWGRDSRSLYYVTPGGLTVIELQTSPSLGVTARPMIRGFPFSDNYDLHPDGRTFVLVSPVRASADILVAVNWADEARRVWRAAAQK